MHGQHHPRSSQGPRRAGTLAVLLAVVALAASAASAQAAAPVNDDLANAIAVTPGYSATLDTTGATPDAAAEELLLQGCIGEPTEPATGTVWYTYTAPADGIAIFDFSASDYFLGAVIASGGPGDWKTERCLSELIVPFYARAGTTYTVLVLDHPFDGTEVVGGTLGLTVSRADYPQVAFDPIGTVDNRTGFATVTGTATCPEGDEFVASLRLDQPFGRAGIVEGTGRVEFVCDGRPHEWSAVLRTLGARFAGGMATLEIDTTYGSWFGFVTDCVGSVFDCVSQSGRVRLRGGR